MEKNCNLKANQCNVHLNQKTAKIADNMTRGIRIFLKFYKTLKNFVSLIRWDDKIIIAYFHYKK